MRLFYDDDLCCVFEKLQADLTSLCVISSVCKSWNTVVQHFLLQAKKEYFSQLKLTLSKYIYKCHNWFFSSDFDMFTQYDWNSGGCIAFCHSTITTCGKYKEETIKFLHQEETHLRFEPSCVSLVDMPFITRLQNLPLFRSLKEKVTFTGGAREIKIEGKWSNEFVTVTCNGYCPLSCHIKTGDDYKDVRSHINWTNAKVSLN